MSEWKEVNLKDICLDISYGYTASATQNEHGIKFLRITDIVNKPINWQQVPSCEITQKDIQKYSLSKGDIVIARTGATTGHNYTFNSHYPSVFASYLIRYKIDQDLADPFYVGYSLQSDNWKGFVENIIGGSAQPGANAQQFASYELPLPPLPEQQAIAEVLSSLDDKIDLLHRNNKTLEEMAETLFRQWFVEGAKEEWEEFPLDVLAEYLNGLALQKFPAEKGQPTIPAIKIREMNQGITDSTDRVSTNIPEKYLVHNGDILFSWSGSLDVIIWSHGTGALNQHLFKVIPINLPKWLVYFATRLFLPDFRDIASDKATTMGHIQRHHLSDAKIKLPDFKYIPKLDKIIDPIFKKMLQSKEQINMLRSLRDALLPKLMSGQVRVGNN
jgi:type I restriction enzyme S subunit